MDIQNRGVNNIISKIKQDLLENINKEVTIKYSIGRNKFEQLKGKITKIYPNFFMLEINNADYMEYRTFSYADVLTKIVTLLYK